MNGGAIVKVGDLYRVVPVEKVTQLPLDPMVNAKDFPDDERMVLNLIFLKYAIAAEISKLIQPFLGEGATMATYDPANLLILQDNSRNLKRTMQLIGLFDNDAFVSQRVQLFDVRHGRPADLVTSQRSSVASELDEACLGVRAILEMGGAEAHTSDGYPGWKPDLGSAILKTAKATYKALYGKDPEVKAIHAGLECGIIGERYPGMDMVSFGPTLEGVHSPDEKIHIDTVPKFWDFLLGILKAVN